MLPPIRSLALTAALAAAAFPACAKEPFRLTSSSFRDGGRLPEQQVLDKLGCNGGNLSPSLSWSGAPAGTRSFAITAYDPDAPTGSGWWHWLVFDLPARVDALAEGASALPPPAVQGRTDFGTPGYGGACPPAGAKPHRYVFTVYALDVDTLNLPADAGGALVGFNLGAHTLAKARLTARYGR